MSSPLSSRSAHRSPAPPAYQKLSSAEQFWRNRYHWLLEHGYTLRSRYHPDWKPSWTGTVDEAHWGPHEDAQVGYYPQLLDATRMSDGSFVKLKLVNLDEHPHEAEISTFMSSEPIASDPRNRCVPVLQVLVLPDISTHVIMVMPLLLPYEDVRFDSFGEAVDMFRQLFEGLQLMHEHHIAHRDISKLNVLMDASGMAKTPWHPIRTYMSRDYSRESSFRTRTECPPKYYFVDFGISRRYATTDKSPKEPRWIGGDKTVPEFQDDTAELHNPFHTDIYYMGNFIRDNFMRAGPLSEGYFGFDFMEPLIKDMVQADPEKRPTMDEVVDRFATIVKNLSPWKLRSRVVARDEPALRGFFRTMSHWKRRVEFIVHGTQAIPKP